MVSPQNIEIVWFTGKILKIDGFQGLTVAGTIKCETPPERGLSFLLSYLIIAGQA
jgi:hypothetical protein